MKATEIKKLEKKLQSLRKREIKAEERVEIENEKAIEVANNIPWGAGMRRTKVTPSFARLDAAEERLKKIRNEIKQIQNKLNELQTKTEN